MFNLFSPKTPEDQVRREHAVMLAALRKIVKACKPGMFDLNGIDVGTVAKNAINEVSHGE